MNLSGMTDNVKLSIEYEANFLFVKVSNSGISNC